jgi:hypothetical protein
VHARDQLLADVAREVEVDVRQRGELLVEEAPRKSSFSTGSMCESPVR